MRNKYGFPAVVFSNAYCDVTLTRSHNNWSCLCRYDQLPCACYVLVEFSDNEGEFDDPYTQTAKSTFHVDITTCKIDCSNARIVINSTDKFTGRTAGYGTEKRFFYNEECVSGTTILNDLATGYKVLSLQELIEHELGHFWGLPDVTKKDAAGKEVSACPPFKYVSVMDGVQSESDYNKLRLPITNDDECQFKLLYCKDDPIVSYDDYNYELYKDNCSNYPNPFNEQTKIQFEIVQSEKFVVIEIYNQFGEKLENLTGGIYSPGNYSLTFDGCNYPSGVYYYRLMIDDSLICTEKMILLK
ncbi:T9SS C-terminal target domain-containing protein [Bacteroidetes/Chlorobi group bacterium ChocPot_Mid]|nr:MAG: T9SS C-terminal target domain-containing protein [Bacteroidetes/Chlorobi group bacterium ChocPot_Mid]